MCCSAIKVSVASWPGLSMSSTATACSSVALYLQAKCVDDHGEPLLQDHYGSQVPACQLACMFVPCKSGWIVQEGTKKNTQAYDALAHPAPCRRVPRHLACHRWRSARRARTPWPPSLSGWHTSEQQQQRAYPSPAGLRMQTGASLASRRAVLPTPIGGPVDLAPAARPPSRPPCSSGDGRSHLSAGVEQSVPIGQGYLNFNRITGRVERELPLGPAR